MDAVYDRRGHHGIKCGRCETHRGCRVAEVRKLVQSEEIPESLPDVVARERPNTIALFRHPIAKMALPLLTQHIAQTKLGAYCEKKIPADVRDRVRLVLEFADNEITLVETRPYFRDPTQWTRLPVARFRFNAASGTWSLDCPNLREKGGWRLYPVQSAHDLDKLIRALDEDTSGVFWG